MANCERPGVKQAELCLEPAYSHPAMIVAPATTVALGRAELFVVFRTVPASTPFAVWREKPAVRLPLRSKS